MKRRIAALLCAIVLLFTACGSVTPSRISLAEIPPYSGIPYVEMNGNQPDFDSSELTERVSEYYSPLDALGRPGTVSACIGTSCMPTEERGEIGQVKPAGWHTVKYDVVDGKYLYNRCHLIGYQLTGENANERNLITGTRYMNVDGMLPFEEQVADYVRATDHHVLYRVTPLYDGDNLVAHGVEMQAQSIEDDAIRFHVYVYNVQPGVMIDYATGESCLENTKPTEPTKQAHYVLNTSSKKFHKPSCSSASKIKPKNKRVSTDSREALMQAGYQPCKSCKP